MNQYIIDACVLYRDALKENQAELSVPLNDLIVVYVPNMPHSHRTLWFESNLILLYKTENPDEYGDFITVSDGYNKNKRGLHFNGLPGNDIDYHVTKMACDNLQEDFNTIYKPFYIEIDPIHLVKIPRLLACT